MISITCPGCHSKLNAKDDLAGQTRKCPKCGTAVQIPAPVAVEITGLAEAAPDQHVHGTTEDQLPSISAPERLVRQNKYAICDKAHLVATWENNGNGWMLKTNFGLVSAVRNQESLPAQGDFKLVELKMEMTDNGLRLHGLTVYQLAKRWALTNLERGDDKVLSTVTGPGFLNKDQKAVIRRHIKDQFMRRVWEDSHNVLDYLLNGDYHSPGVD